MRWLQTIKGLPPWDILCTTDADSMYTNIDTEHAIRIIGEWLDELSTHLNFPPGYPLNAVKSAMAAIANQSLRVRQHELPAEDGHRNGHLSCLHVGHHLLRPPQSEDTTSKIPQVPTRRETHPLDR